MSAAHPTSEKEKRRGHDGQKARADHQQEVHNLGRHGGRVHAATRLRLRRCLADSSPSFWRAASQLRSEGEILPAFHFHQRLL